jgi:hypothetical protein
MSTKIGFVLLGIFLIILAISYFGTNLIPAIALGIVALLTGIFIIVGQFT